MPVLYGSANAITLGEFSLTVECSSPEMQSRLAEEVSFIGGVDVHKFSNATIGSNKRYVQITADCITLDKMAAVGEVLEVLMAG